MFEEYQQPAIQTKIDSCPQNWDHGLMPANQNPNLNEKLLQTPKYELDAAFRNPNMNRGCPAYLKNLKDDKICQTEQINQ
jgi:hypothetical protein